LYFDGEILKYNLMISLDKSIFSFSPLDEGTSVPPFTIELVNGRFHCRQTIDEVIFEQGKEEIIDWLSIKAAGRVPSTRTLAVQALRDGWESNELQVLE